MKKNDLLKRETPTANASDSPLVFDSDDSPNNTHRTKHTIDWLLFHCLGFGACFGWVHIIFFSTVFWGDAGEALGLNSWLINVGANGIAMIVLGCLSIKLDSLIRNKVVVSLSILLILMGAIGLATAQMGISFLVYFGAATSGVGSAAFLLFWAEEYKAISPTVAKKYTIPLSMACGVFYFLLISMLPRMIAMGATILLPIASFIFLQLSRRVPRPHEKERVAVDSDIPMKHSISWRSIISIRFLFVTAVYCLAPGFMRGYTSALPFASAGGIGEAMFSGVAIVMILISIASIIVFKDSKIDLAYKMVVPLMAAGLLLLPFLASGQETLAATAIMSGYILFEMYVWVSMSDKAANVNAPTALVFGIGKVGMNIGLLVGSFLGLYFGLSSTMLLVGISVFIVYLFVVIENVASPGIGVAFSFDALHAKSPKDKLTQEKITITEAAQMDLSEVFSAVLNERCNNVAITHSLSQRETEVLELLARGRSLQAIADTLNIAYSTVKTHTDRIYSKTEVHSRQELISLLEET